MIDAYADRVGRGENLPRNVGLFTELKASGRKSELDELERRLEERLAVLQQPDARSRLDSMLTARGKLAIGKRPVAGESF